MAPLFPTPVFFHRPRLYTLFFRFTLFLLFIFLFIFLIYFGFCFRLDKPRDRAILLTAVDHLLEQQTAFPIQLYWDQQIRQKQLSTDYYSFNYLPYDSREAFFAANPDCCSFSYSAKKGTQPTLYSRISGQVNRYVRIDYQRRYREPSGEISVYKHVTFYAVSNCGRVWRGYG